MALITRLTRLFRADLHAVLDQLEEPDVLLRQAIREMEDAVQQNSQQLTSLERERKQLAQRLIELDRRQRELNTKLDLSFAANNDALIRSLLRRRLEIDQGQRQLMQRAALLDTAHGNQCKQLSERRRLLEDIRQQAALYEVTSAREPGNWPEESSRITDEDVELALLQEQQKRSTS